MHSDLGVIRISSSTELRTEQRKQKKTIQAATADLLASAALLEKVLDGNLDNESHALVNAAYFQINQVQMTFEKLVAQVDNLILEDKNRE